MWNSGTLRLYQSGSSHYRVYIDVYQWFSMITTVQGDVYYRESRDFSEKSRATLLIRKHKNDLHFTPTYLLIITWDNICEHSLNNKVSIEKGIIFTF